MNIFIWKTYGLLPKKYQISIRFTKKLFEIITKKKLLITLFVD